MLWDKGKTPTILSPLLPTATATLPEVAIKAQEDILNSQDSMLTREYITIY